MPESNDKNSAAVRNSKKVCMGCYRENIELVEIPSATRHFLDKHSLLDKMITQVCQHCLTEFEGFKESPANYLTQKKLSFMKRGCAGSIVCQI